jgi:hypothetical protein
MLQAYLVGCGYFLGFIALLSHLNPQDDWQLRQAGWRGLILATLTWPAVLIGVAFVVARRHR